MVVTDQEALNFNLIIRFQPGHLSTKLDALTHRPDLHLKEGGKTYGDVNPHNFKPIFSSEQISASLQQISASLQATSLLPTVLCGVQAMDVEQLNKDILSVLSTDFSAQSYKADSSNPKYLSWTTDPRAMSKLIKGSMSQILEIFGYVSFIIFMTTQCLVILV